MGDCKGVYVGGLWGACVHKGLGYMEMHMYIGGWEYMGSYNGMQGHICI